MIPPQEYERINNLPDTPANRLFPEWELRVYPNQMATAQAIYDKFVEGQRWIMLITYPHNCSSDNDLVK